MIGICVKTNGSFTIFEDYELDFGYDLQSDKVVVLGDDGCSYIVEYNCDGYYGCVDINWKEVNLLVEQHFLLKLKSMDGLY